MRRRYVYLVYVVDYYSLPGKEETLRGVYSTLKAARGASESLKALYARDGEVYIHRAELNSIGPLTRV